MRTSHEEPGKNKEERNDQEHCRNGAGSNQPAQSSTAGTCQSGKLLLGGCRDSAHGRRWGRRAARFRWLNDGIASVPAVTNLDAITLRTHAVHQSERGAFLMSALEHCMLRRGPSGGRTVPEDRVLSQSGMQHMRLVW